MQKYEKFEHWFNEIENYSLRSDRFYEEFQNMDPKRAIEWLKAAWECAREEGCPYCGNPALTKIFFDQTCSGCVDRMNKFARSEEW